MNIENPDYGFIQRLENYLAGEQRNLKEWSAECTKIDIYGSEHQS